MAEEQRRSIRVRHPSKFHNSQLGQRSLQEGGGEKCETLPTSQRKEIKQSILPNTTLARLLVTFLNQANQNHRQYKKSTKRQKNDKEEKVDPKTAQPVPTNSQDHEMTRKCKFNVKKDQNNRLHNKPQEPYSFKGGNLNANKTKSQMYGQTNPINMTVVQGLQNNNFPNQQYLNQVQNVYGTSYQNNSSNICSSISAIIKQQNMMNQIIQGRAIIQKWPGMVDGNNPRIFLANTPRQISDGKLFKRSSYHVAIAYHIYFRKIQNNLYLNSNIIDLDPTSRARKLREQKSKDVQPNQLPQQSKRYH